MSSGDGKRQLRVADVADRRISVKVALDVLVQRRHLARRHLLAALLGLQHHRALAHAGIVANRLLLLGCQVLHPAAELLVASLRVHNGRRLSAGRQHRHLCRQLHHHSPLEAGRTPNSVSDLERRQAKLFGPVDAQHDHFAIRHGLVKRVAQPLILDAAGLIQAIYRLAFVFLCLGRRVDGHPIDDLRRRRLRAVGTYVAQGVLLRRVWPFASGLLLAQPTQHAQEDDRLATTVDDRAVLEHHAKRRATLPLEIHELLQTCAHTCRQLAQSL
jgi:hypothetical protein